MKHLNRQLKIVTLMHHDLVPPDSVEGLPEKEIQPWKMEFDVQASLRHMGHEVHPVGIHSDLGVITEALNRVKPDIVFNMIEAFDGQVLFDQHVVSFLEMKNVPYTGCNPRGLTLARDKALSKKILAYHRIPVPAFAVFDLRRKIKRPPKLAFPLLVKSLIDEGSVGISRASVVHDEEALAERVKLIHRQSGSPAITEQYIAGRELYMSVMGNDRLQTFTPWELVMSNLPEGAPNIATSKLKWSYAHQAQVGLSSCPAKLTAEEHRRLGNVAKRIYRSLYLSGYARLDFRMSPEGVFYLLEANPNPCISYGEDFAEAVETAGVSYEDMIDRMLRNGLNYRQRL